MLLFERNPWLPEFLAMGVPIAIGELRGHASPRDEADRLTREHQVRVGVTTRSPDWDSWAGGDSSVPLTVEPVATSAASLLGAMSEGLHYPAPSKLAPGRKSPNATDPKRMAVLLAALSRGLAAAALTATEGVALGGLHWCADMACPDEIPDRPIWIGEGGLEGLSSAMWAAVQRVSDEAWAEHVASGERRFQQWTERRAS